MHHTATPWDSEPGVDAILAILGLHRDQNGWEDIGYNFIVDRQGFVYEARAGGPELAVVGAHTRGWNARSTGVALIGDFSAEAPGPEQLEGLAALLAWKLPLHGVHPGQDTVVGHGALDPGTACPGDRLAAHLPGVSRRSRLLAAGPAR